MTRSTSTKSDDTPIIPTNAVVGIGLVSNIYMLISDVAVVAMTPFGGVERRVRRGIGCLTIEKQREANGHSTPVRPASDWYRQIVVTGGCVDRTAGTYPGVGRTRGRCNCATMNRIGIRCNRKLRLLRVRRTCDQAAYCKEKKPCMEKANA